MPAIFLCASLVVSAVLGAPPSPAGPAQESAAEDLTTLTHTAVVPAPIDEVWQAFTTREGVESWMVAQAEIELRVGGAMRTHYDPEGVIGDAGTIENTYIAIVPQRLLAFRCTRAPEDAPFKDVIGDMWSAIMFQAEFPRATRITLLGVGYTMAPESQQMREFFKWGNQHVLDSLVSHFEKRDSASGEGTILRLLHGLVGEWNVENVRPDGSVFRARSIYELGPDGMSIVGRGWLGNAESLTPHANTQIWDEPLGGGIRFQSIDENGAIARGGIALEGDDTLVWQWKVTTQTGHTAQYVVKQTLLDEDSFRFLLLQRGEGDQLQERVSVIFHRKAGGRE